MPKRLAAFPAILLCFAAFCIHSQTQAQVLAPALAPRIAAAAAAAAKKGVRTTLVEFPSVSHLMIDGKGSMSPAEYTKPSLVSREVIDRIGGWIKGRARMTRP